MNKEMWLILLTVGLISICFYLFKLNIFLWGNKEGYFIGFVFYWMWCLLVPLIFIGKEEIKLLYTLKFPELRKRKLLAALFLILPLIFGYGYAFPKVIVNAESKIITLSFFLALVNASFEELLWRGTFIKIFQANKFVCIFYAGTTFGVWHIIPLSFSATIAPGGMISFIAFAVVLGWLYGWIAWSSKSIFWVTISHILLDFSGLGARIYFS
jgi:membrane protease YdiL (CAAX protease family)